VTQRGRQPGRRILLEARKEFLRVWSIALARGEPFVDSRGHSQVPARRDPRFAGDRISYSSLKGSSWTCAPAGPDDPYRVDFFRGDGQPMAALRLPPAIHERPPPGKRNTPLSKDSFPRLKEDPSSGLTASLRRSFPCTGLGLDSSSAQLSIRAGVEPTTSRRSTRPMISSGAGGPFT